MGCAGIRDRDPGKTYLGSRTRIEGLQNHRIPDADPQHWYSLLKIRSLLVRVILVIPFRVRKINPRSETSEKYLSLYGYQSFHSYYQSITKIFYKDTRHTWGSRYRYATNEKPNLDPHGHGLRIRLTITGYGFGWPGLRFTSKQHRSVHIFFCSVIWYP